jgi:hypothetical protein
LEASPLVRLLFGRRLLLENTAEKKEKKEKKKKGRKERKERKERRERKERTLVSS